jgi:hypothetical protein
MTAAAITECAVPADPVAVFREHCEARAALVRAGALDLHDAVDGLEAIGLEAIGQDAVQEIMASAFRPRVTQAEFLDAYRREWEANRKTSDADCSLGAMMAIVEASMRGRGVPKSTLDAADYMRDHATDDELRRWLEDHQRYIDEILEHWRHDRAA